MIVRKTGIAAAVLALATACGVAPLTADPSATAPRLEGFGHVGMAVTTRSPEAQALFEQGMEQAYAFNGPEARRAFKAALARDPDCAMCAWGVSWQMGPNINDPERGDLTEARRYAAYAASRATNATPREQGVIAALQLRYAEGPQARDAAVENAAVCTPGSGGDRPADPLDVAYAKALRKLIDQYPDDPDLLSFYAEAELIATPGDNWDRVTGKPMGNIGFLADRLEAALVHHADHTGLNHYLIHTVDDVHNAARAVAASDRLGTLAPRSPHLLHMPAHIYVQVGRYADATQVNTLALAADDAEDAELKAQGFKPTKDWRGHNGHFQWYGALMQGRGDMALEIARRIADRAGHRHDEYLDYQRSLTLITLVRLARWDAVLAEPPLEGTAMATLMSQSARGTALARKGRVEEAQAALELVMPAVQKTVKKHPTQDLFDKALRGIAQASEARLRAEIALARHQWAEALAQQALAITAADDADRLEPPYLGAGSRLALAEMQMQAQRYTAAEQSLRAELALRAQSGWALNALAKSLEAQGRQSEATPVRVAAAKAWPQADAGLR
ncbi:MAG TPA: hypothetical protein VGM81_00150 [Burkholderiaceae bacterium]|jgi:tetratricopeptide (TPR) repeat protein